MAFIDKYRQQIQMNAPVVYEGLEFHPLTVRDYSLYANTKPAFELMLSSLSDPKLARLSWCACLWELDRRCEQQTGTPGMFLTGVMFVMAVALRLDVTADGSFQMRPVFAQSGELNAIMVGNPQTDYALFNMRQMDDVRQIIAAQNDYEIPNEDWNPELVKAAQENAARVTSDLKYDFEDLVYSVALNAHCRASEVYDWTIREFHKIQAAIDRAYGHMIYTLAEKSGYVTFKKGNPYPTWKFDRKNDMPFGFISIAELDEGGKGLVAGTDVNPF